MAVIDVATHQGHGRILEVPAGCKRERTGGGLDLTGGGLDLWSSGGTIHYLE